MGGPEANRPERDVAEAAGAPERFFFKPFESRLGLAPENNRKSVLPEKHVPVTLTLCPLSGALSGALSGHRAQRLEAQFPHICDSFQGFNSSFQPMRPLFVWISTGQSHSSPSGDSVRSRSDQIALADAALKNQAIRNENSYTDPNYFLFFVFRGELTNVLSFFRRSTHKAPYTRTDSESEKGYNRKNLATLGVQLM